MARRELPPAIPITEQELKRRLAVWRGKRARTRADRPEPGTGKSTTLRLSDIALLARIYRPDLYNFLLGKTKFGDIKKKRLYKVLLEVEGGLVTKSQFGVYHFHDTPQRAPSRVMQVNLGTGKIAVAEKQQQVGKMPSFDKIFR